jgi:threonine synthase
MPPSATSDRSSGQPGAGSKVSFVFRCIGCGAAVAETAQDYRCQACGNLFEIVANSWKAVDPGKLRSTWRERRASNLTLDRSGVWRFRELLPLPDKIADIVTLREGNTPLYELPLCSRITGVARLYAKHQGMNPTGSFKDTGMTVAATFARQSGSRWVACASTGNTDFDGCLRLLQELVKQAPVYQLNSINPFRLEGQKTLAFELLEQRDWQPPDHIIVPGGNLGNSSAIGKGLLEMRELGLISRLPKLSVIQAEGANALVRTLREEQGKRLVNVEAETRATAIRIGNPVSWEKAVRVIQATGGTCEQVSEIEIAQAKAEIGAEGIGCEPASAVTLAGLKKLVEQRFVKKDESVVLVLTGNLLKDPDFTMEFHRGDLFRGDLREESNSSPLASLRHPPVVLEATIKAVLRALEQSEREQSDRSPNA